MNGLKKIILVLVVSILFLPNICINVYAESNGIADIEEFDDLSGDAQYLGSTYRDNYYLDIEDLGVLDAGYSIMNSLANVLFGFVTTFAYITVSIFYFSMDFDISNLLAPQIGAIQTALNTGIFKPLFLLALFGTFMAVALRLWRRDLAGVGGEMAKVLAVIVISFFVINDSATAMSYATNITKSLSVAILNGVNDAYGVSDSGAGYAAQSAGILWINLVHEPWKTLEFGKHIPSDDEVESFLSLDPGAEVRQELTDGFTPKESFDKSRGSSRIGFCLAYLVPFLIKCIIYLLIALIQIVFQLLAIFFLLLAALVLIMALIPGYGMQIVTVWLKKMLETQISILIVSFLLALLIRIDELMYALAPTMGWFPVLIFQVGMGVGLFVFRDKVLHAFGNIQRTVQNPGNFKNWINNAGNPYQTVERGIATHERRKILKNMASVKNSGLAKESQIRSVSINSSPEPDDNHKKEKRHQSTTKSTYADVSEVKRPITTNDEAYWEYLAKSRSGTASTTKSNNRSWNLSTVETYAMEPASRPLSSQELHPGALQAAEPASRPLSSIKTPNKPSNKPVSERNNPEGEIYQKWK